MKRLAILSLFSVLILLSSCVHFKVPTKVSTINIYSVYEDKIHGTVGLIIDDNLKHIASEVKSSTHQCSLCSFSVDLKSSLATSVKQATEFIFDQVVETSGYSSKEETIYIKLEKFNPTIVFGAGIIVPNGCTATCEITLEIRVKDRSGNVIMGSTVSSSKTAQGEAEIHCNNANLLSDAISNSIKEVVQKYAETISNSRKIREAFVQKTNLVGPCILGGVKDCRPQIDLVTKKPVNSCYWWECKKDGSETRWSLTGEKCNCPSQVAQTSKTEAGGGGGDAFIGKIVHAKGAGGLANPHAELKAISEDGTQFLFSMPKGVLITDSNGQEVHVHGFSESPIRLNKKVEIKYSVTKGKYEVLKMHYLE
jgi:hypothetical protein